MIRYLYEYRCVACRSVVTEFRAKPDRNRPATCSKCGVPANRIISVPQHHKGVWQTPTDPDKMMNTKEIWT